MGHDPDRRGLRGRLINRHTDGRLYTVSQTISPHPVSLELEPVTMDLDAPWVERIVANLLRNVVRHTPPTTAVSIRTNAVSEGVEIIVDDLVPPAGRGSMRTPRGAVLWTTAPALQDRLYRDVPTRLDPVDGPGQERRSWKRRDAHCARSRRTSRRS